LLSCEKAVTGCWQFFGAGLMVKERVKLGIVWEFSWQGKNVGERIGNVPPTSGFLNDFFLREENEDFIL
jgi:hypothetical protein